MNNPLINPGLGTFFWMIVSFGVLVFILCKWGWPMLLKALTKREKAIEDSLNAAEKARQELEMLKAQNLDLLRDARAERDEMLRIAKATKEDIIEKAHAEATAEADRMIEKARESIENEKLKAMHDLKNQIAMLSIDIAEKLIKTELSDKQKAESLIQRELENAHLN